MSDPLLDCFDRISIINLPERADRRRQVTRELQALGVAVDGERVRFVGAIRPDSAAGFPSTGARGCFMSHLKALRQARADSVRRLLVLEDDVVFSALVRRSDWLASDLRRVDWHLAYPGHIEAPQPGPLRWERTHQPLQCSHAVAVRGDAFDPLIGFLEACLARAPGHPQGGPMHYDGALSVLRAQRPDLITLRASRSLAWQRPSRSDIVGPSWIDRAPVLGLAAGARWLRNGWRRLADAR